MKRLIAMISIGRDASNFFPDVVKNVVCDSLEVKKLVYMFLTHYAEAKSNEALLTINTFQKDLSDTNQVGSHLLDYVSLDFNVLYRHSLFALQR